MVGHDGMKKCKERITECFWPDMDNDLKKHMTKCLKCKFQKSEVWRNIWAATNTLNVIFPINAFKWISLSHVRHLTQGTNMSDPWQMHSWNLQRLWQSQSKGQLPWQMESSPNGSVVMDAQQSYTWIWAKSSLTKSWWNCMTNWKSKAQKQHQHTRNAIARQRYSTKISLNTWKLWLMKLLSTGNGI